ncbi:MAG TPA: cache domain-containing protein [Acidobacteriota bacterium]|nr:cache domain-containing protein [Acidobacteriota bacterium]
MKLQTKINIGIISVFLILGASMAVLTFKWQNDHAIKAAENRVRLYIKAGWEIYNSKIERIQATLKVLAEDQRLRRLLHDQSDQRLLQEVVSELQVVRSEQNMDILNVLDRSGRVLLRARHPELRFDTVTDDPMIRRVIAEKQSCGGTVLLDQKRLEAEGNDLAEWCRRYSAGETAGMMTGAAVPILSNGRLIGIIQMGNLLNGSVEKVDRIRDSLFENEHYDGKPVGTATVFMGDLRISTNVLDENGRRAIGTRASPEVAEQVLRKGLPWNGRALVVNAWYLSQYVPIRDPDDRVIGMLYIGSLEKRYLDQRSRAIFMNLAMVFGGMILAMTVFFWIMRTILSPIRRLHLATRRLSKGNLTHRIEVKSRDEIGELSESFNHMTQQLLEDQLEIQESQAELERRNHELRVTNRNYMELLGFVSHELKSPLGSAILGVYSIKDGYLGPVSEAQQRILASVASSLDYLNEMIKHYLDLSRLEKGELRVNKQTVRFKEEIMAPSIQGLMPALEDKRMILQNEVPDDFLLSCDPQLMRIVFENLLSNAVKYGRVGGRIQIDAVQCGDESIWHVMNEGDGIPADKLGLLFQKFSRIDPPKNGKKGTGLGLYICKEIVEQHGGKISSESVEGEWTRFTVALPADATIQEKAQHDQNKSQDPGSG